MSGLSPHKPSIGLPRAHARVRTCNYGKIAAFLYASYYFMREFVNRFYYFQAVKVKLYTKRSADKGLGVERCCTLTVADSMIIRSFKKKGATFSF